MAKKLVKKDNKKQKSESLFELVIRMITGIYMVVVLCGMPLYAPDTYYSIGDHKWKYWIISTAIYVGVMALIGIGWLVDKYIVKKNKASTGKNAKSTKVTADNASDRNEAGLKGKCSQILNWLNINLTITDKFVAGYLVVVLIGSLFSPYKDQILIGTTGWNMGLLSQLGFVLTYFIVSRTWKASNGFMKVVVVCSTLVFLFGVLMRFGNDPIGFYNGLTEEEKFNFISTLGQTSWYSSFLVLLVPIAIIFYHQARSFLGKICATVAVVIGYMSMVTQNSDSAYLALGAYMLVYLWVAFDNYSNFKKFFEVLIINLASFRFVGILQTVYADRATKLDSLSMAMSQSNLITIALIAVVIIYVVLVVLEKTNKAPDVTKIAFLRLVAIAFVVVAAIGAVIYVALNTSGKLPANLASDNNYLLFNDYWGNNRGISWKSAGTTFVKENWWRKLMGTGPDTFGASVYEYCSVAIHDYFYNLTGQEYVLYCAHNEWLNELITGGIIGLCAYLGLFVAAMVSCLKNRKKYPELVGVAMAVAAYFGHNIFCYQQVICTSVIFLLIGIAEATIRKGHVEWDELDAEDDGKNNYTFIDVIKGLMSLK